MLSDEQKKLIIEQRILDYETKIFNLEVGIVALRAIGDETGIKSSQERIEMLRKAIDAVKEMRV